MTSAVQDQWVDIMDSVRGQLAKMVPAMGAMTPSELKTFIEAINLARYEDQAAGCYDDELQKRLVSAQRVYDTD